MRVSLRHQLRGKRTPIRPTYGRFTSISGFRDEIHPLHACATDFSLTRLRNWSLTSLGAKRNRDEESNVVYLVVDRLEAIPRISNSRETCSFRAQLIHQLDSTLPSLLRSSEIVARAREETEDDTRR